jgi:hypothetical protein
MFDEVHTFYHYVHTTLLWVKFPVSPHLTLTLEGTIGRIVQIAFADTQLKSSPP